MAGIKEAMRRVMDGRNTGEVVAMGTVNACTCKNNEGCSACCNESYRPPYIIIKLKDGGFITSFDFNGDVKIHPLVELHDKVTLMILDNWCAVWKRSSDVFRGSYFFEDALAEKYLKEKEKENG